MQLITRSRNSTKRYDALFTQLQCVTDFPRTSVGRQPKYAVKVCTAQRVEHLHYAILDASAVMAGNVPVAGLETN